MCAQRKEVFSFASVMLFTFKCCPFKSSRLVVTAGCVFFELLSCAKRPFLSHEKTSHLRTSGFSLCACAIFSRVSHQNIRKTLFFAKGKCVLSLFLCVRRTAQSSPCIIILSSCMYVVPQPRFRLARLQNDGKYFSSQRVCMRGRAI
jgi:hypothetical protein